jgi:excisionase family DNA binding protein
MLGYAKRTQIYSKLATLMTPALERMRFFMGATDRRLLNSREAARYLGISLNTLYRMEKGGLLRPFRTPGGHRRYPITMLDSYLELSRDNSSRASIAR